MKCKKEEVAADQALFAKPKPRSTIFYKVLSVTPFQQPNGYYCGPATVKQTLHYINGSSLSQDSYASSLRTTNSGTDMTLIAPRLNQNQSRKTYRYNQFTTLSAWITYARDSLSNNVPAIMDINNSSVSGWPYSTTGHFINLSGLNYDSEDGPGLNTALVTDPFAPGFGNKWYAITTVYNANRNHFRSAIIH